MNRPKLLLLCGLLCDAQIWEPVAAQLRAHADISIISFPGIASIEAMAARVLAAAPDRFAVAGHSMGGRVALEIARVDPRRLTALALLNTGIHPPGVNEPTERGRLVEIASSRGMKVLADVWLPPMMAADRAPNEDLMRDLTAMIERSSTESFAAQVNALLHRPNARESLADVRVPTQLVAATGDRWSPPRQHEEMRRICPGSQLTIVAEAGHMAPVEQPVAVAAALAGWLQRTAEVQAAATTLTPNERVLIEQHCTRQILRFARLNDNAAYEPLSRLFVENGIWIRPSEPDVVIQGRANILESFRSRPARLTRHIVSNIEVTVESAGRAFATSTIALHVGDAAIAAVGSFDDVFEKTRHEWLFRERRGRITFKGASA